MVWHCTSTLKAGRHNGNVRIHRRKYDLQQKYKDNSNNVTTRTAYLINPALCHNRLSRFTFHLRPLALLVPEISFSVAVISLFLPAIRSVSVDGADKDADGAARLKGFGCLSGFAADSGGLAIGELNYKLVVAGEVVADEGANFLNVNERTTFSLFVRGHQAFCLHGYLLHVKHQ